MVLSNLFCQMTEDSAFSLSLFSLIEGFSFFSVKIEKTKRRILMTWLDFFYYRGKIAEIHDPGEHSWLEKTAAARWKIELLKKPTSWIESFLRRAKKGTPVPSTHQRELIGESTASILDDAIYRDSLLRRVRGDYDDAVSALIGSAQLQANRGTVAHRVLGRPVPSVEMPMNLETTAWRGLNGGQWGRPRQEYLIGGRLYHSGKRGMPVYYGSRPEVAAEYALDRNMTMSPFWTKGQNYVGEFELDQILPRLFNKYHTVKNQHLPSQPWTSHYIDQSTKDVGFSNQFKAFQQGRREGNQYQITGSGHGVPYKQLYKVDRQPIDISTISREGGKRLREARDRRLFADFINGDTTLTPIELLEPTTSPMKRSKAFFERYSSPEAKVKHSKGKTHQTAKQRDEQRLRQELGKKVKRWEKFEPTAAKYPPVTDEYYYDLLTRYPHAEFEHGIDSVIDKMRVLD
jgi:hypothetical protein